MYGPVWKCKRACSSLAWRMYESAREGSERELAAASHDVYMKVQENLQQRSMYVITPPHPTIYIYIYISYEDFKKAYKTLVRFSTRRPEHPMARLSELYNTSDWWCWPLQNILVIEDNVGVWLVWAPPQTILVYWIIVSLSTISLHILYVYIWKI